jgi:hypothetical protein
MTALMDPVIQYVFLIGITLLFSILAVNRDSITFHALAAFTWFATSLGHMMIGQQTSPLTIALAFLYLGIGLIFTISTLDKTLAFLKEKRVRLEL